MSRCPFVSGQVQEQKSQDKLFCPGMFQDKIDIYLSNCTKKISEKMTRFPSPIFPVVERHFPVLEHPFLIQNVFFCFRTSFSCFRTSFCSVPFCPAGWDRTAVKIQYRPNQYFDRLSRPVLALGKILSLSLFSKKLHCPLSSPVENTSLKSTLSHMIRYDAMTL